MLIGEKGTYWYIVLYKRYSCDFRKSRVVESQLPDELDVEEDDIITDTPPPIPQHSLFSAPGGQSQPVGKVFIEKSSE